MLQTALSGSTADISYRARSVFETLGRPLLETASCGFDVQAFVRAGHATSRAKPSVCQELLHGWHDGIRTHVETGWLEVEWDGETFDVILLAWDSAGCRQSRKFVLASSLDRAEALFTAVCHFCTGTVDREILVFEDGYFQKSHALWKAINAASLEDLVLTPEIVTRLREDFVGFFQAKDVYARYRIPHKRGALFIGPPGNGKTHAIKALVRESGKTCLYVKSVRSRGDTDHANIRDIFERARETSPCVLVLEDIDALVTDQNRSLFLNELDGFATNEGLLVVATSNHADRLDPALAQRPSRFDRKYLFDVPAMSLRARYLDGWNARLEEELLVSPAVLARLAEKTGGFSFAHLKELGTSSILRWVSDNGDFGAILETEAESLGLQVSATELG